jgi:hypothetical protein
MERRFVDEDLHPEGIIKLTKIWMAKGSKSVTYAVKTGKMVKPLYCERCSSFGRLDGHHKDYSKPLQVEWLCRSCHRERKCEWVISHLNIDYNLYNRCLGMVGQ